MTQLETRPAIFFFEMQRLIEYPFGRFIEDYSGALQPAGATFNNSADLDVHVVRVGLNYKLDWGKAPVMANY